MHKDDELCDATLNVDGQEIKVHKVTTRLHQVSASMRSQRCDDACDIALRMKSLPKWVATPFSSDSVSIDFNESCITSVFATLTLR